MKQVLVTFVGAIILLASEASYAQMQITSDVDQEVLNPSSASATVGSYLKDGNTSQALSSVNITWDSFLQPNVGLDLNPDAEDDDILQTYAALTPQLNITDAVSIAPGLRYLNENNISAQESEGRIEGFIQTSWNDNVSQRSMQYGVSFNNETILPFTTTREAGVAAIAYAEPEIESLTEAFLWTGLKRASSLQSGVAVNHLNIGNSLEYGPAVQWSATDSTSIGADYLNVLENSQQVGTRASLSVGYQY